MMIAKVGTLAKENFEWFEKVNKGYKCTGETLMLGDGNESTTHVVFEAVGNNKRTKYMTVRDCGDHYIYAGYSTYYRIDKGTLEITKTDKDC